jgi:cyclic pyranopterin phosphate synthase
MPVDSAEAQPSKGDRLTHVAGDGRAAMVDVGGKAVTARQATASGVVLISAVAGRAVSAGEVTKGDVLTIARIAGIQGAKRTSELVPLCHPVGLTGIDVDVQLAPIADDASDCVVHISAAARTHDRTGIEMEALTAVAVAGLTVIDMVKAIDPHATLGEIRVESKSGGATGEWRR